MSSSGPTISRAGIGKRKPVSASATSLIKTSLLYPDKSLPLLIQPALEGVDLIEWAQQNQAFIAEHLLRYGGLLFRGWSVPSLDYFERFVQASSGDLLEYRERSSPRSQVSGNIYTSTDHPPDQHIFLHNESSYSQTWPLQIFFHCVIPADKGGATPIADCRRIYNRIPADIREKFREKKIMYVRNFGDGFGLPWQTVFQTEERAKVEEYCQKAGLTAEWKDGNRLRTRRLGIAVAKHPKTGEMTWFNHGTFFHVTTLPAAIREPLMATFAEDDLPTNTFYGDGTPIEPEVLDQLREIYHEETVSFPWQKGDVLMLDNMLVAHAREPFEGQRKVVVGMAHPTTVADLPPL